MKQYTNQIQLLHFSDLHFGDHNICNPEDSTASSDGIPSLGELITNDLRNDFGAMFSHPSEYALNEESNFSTPKEPPLLIALSGDFTQKAEHEEFKSAMQFMDKLISTPILNQKVSKEDIFLIPGNHDVQFNEKSPTVRFQPYAAFYNEYFNGVSTRKQIQPFDPLGITQIHKIERQGNKVLIAEINCCMYVQNDTVDKSRGQVSQEAIKKLRKELESYKAEPDFKDYIKIAMIHHHVVLLPSFIEANRGVDSVMHARHLLELISEYNFHLILHGHKHYPQIFTYDPLPLWSANKNTIPQLVIAGGSCGSNELPKASGACNTYCVITIKWHPAATQARIRVITRGLKTTGDRGTLAPDQWKWETVNVSDKTITPYQTLPEVGVSELKVWDTDERHKRYTELRYQMPVVEVMPSLIPGQAYEARAWITPHGNPLPAGQELIKVEWSAGKLFAKQTCLKENNPHFCIAYQYWGPMQIEARLFFEDGYEALAYVYARMPKNEEKK